MGKTPVETEEPQQQAEEGMTLKCNRLNERILLLPRKPH